MTAQQKVTVVKWAHDEAIEKIRRVLADPVTKKIAPLSSDMVDDGAMSGARGLDDAVVQFRRISLSDKGSDRGSYAPIFNAEAIAPYIHPIVQSHIARSAGGSLSASVAAARIAVFMNSLPSLAVDDPAIQSSAAFMDAALKIPGIAPRYGVIDDRRTDSFRMIQMCQAFATVTGASVRGENFVATPQHNVLIRDPGDGRHILVTTVDRQMLAMPYGPTIRAATDDITAAAGVVPFKPLSVG